MTSTYPAFFLKLNDKVFRANSLNKAPTHTYFNNTMYVLPYLIYKEVIIQFFQKKWNQDLYVLINAEDHTKINALSNNILNLNVGYPHSLYVLFATKDLHIKTK